MLTLLVLRSSMNQQCNVNLINLFVPITGVSNPEVHNLSGPRAAVYYFQCTRGPKTKLLAELLRVSYKNRIGLNFTSPFIACGLILSPSELFWIVKVAKVLIVQ